MEVLEISRDKQEYCTIVVVPLPNSTSELIVVGRGGRRRRKGGDRGVL